MKIYLDFILLLNFTFDFLLLTGVSVLLRRNASWNRLLFGAFLGGLSIFLLFLKINSIELFFMKVIISIVMVLSTFGYRNIRYTLRNLFFLYTSSMVLGGFLYFLNVQFSYAQEGLVFYHQGLSVNVLFLIIFSPIILYAYIKQGIRLKTSYANYYQLKLYIDGKEIPLTGFLDTGNQLSDPYGGKPILLVNQCDLKGINQNSEFLMVPYQTAFGTGLMKCRKAEKIWIDKIGYKEGFLIGLMEERIKMDGVNCILNQRILEE